MGVVLSTGASSCGGGSNPGSVVSTGKKSRQKSSAALLQQAVKPAETEPHLGVVTCNHLESNFHLSNKKALFYNMKMYYEALGEDVFTVLPLTFHIQDGI